VQFSHFSVKEFLTSPRLGGPDRDISRYHIYLEPAHTIMAQACLSVLLQSDPRLEENCGVGNNSPLAGYAAKHWVTHAQISNVSSQIRNAMERLFDPAKPYFVAWLQLYNMDSSIHAPHFSVFVDYRTSYATPIYYAALCGFQGLLEHLIVRYPQQVEAIGGRYKTPAVAALAGRYFEIARFLHHKGSSADPRGAGGQTPLYSAAYYGDLEVVQVLIELNADVNCQNILGSTPLNGASHRTHPQSLNVVQLLLENGANPNLRCKDGEAPLSAASRQGSLDVARLLLEHGAEIEARHQGKTAFQVASELRRHEFTKLLSEYGAKGI
jgi:hypothetical protein